MRSARRPGSTAPERNARPAAGRPAARLQALLVTLLWSSSWVLIKIGLPAIHPLLFAGLRYFLAFLCLLPALFLSSRGGSRPPAAPLSRAPALHGAASLPPHVGLSRPSVGTQTPASGGSPLRGLGGRDWLRLLALGLLFYSLTQGAQFVALALLPAAAVSLVLSFTSVIVALLGAVFLSETPGLARWAGLGLFLAGILLYFRPAALAAGERVGLAVAAAGMLANAGSAVLGRSINRRSTLRPIVVTAISMGIGSIPLLAAGLAVAGPPRLPAGSWALIAWLAVINTAFAFALWNHTLRTLQAVESSIINGTMLLQIALLAWVFLGEALSARQIAGMAVAGAGAIVVQLRAGAARPRR